MDFIHNQRNLLYKGHIRTTFLQKAVLALGSSVLSLASPWRDDMISVMGETTGYPALVYMKKKMEDDPIGQRILTEMPRINSKNVDLTYLSTLPHDTLGHHYHQFLKRNQVHPDERRIVNFVDDPDLAYVMTRYRETHDLLHTVLGMPTNMLGEVAVKWIEGIQYRLPLGLFGGPLGALRLGPKHRQRYLDEHLWWAWRVGFNAKFLMNIYYEELWNVPVDEIRKDFNIDTPPYTPQLKKAGK